MSKIYFYAGRDVKDRAAGIIEKLQRIKTSNCAVVFIGKDTDVDELKSEINFINDKNYALFCVLFDDVKLDAGLNMQLGLAQKFKENEIDKLIASLPKKKRTLLIVIALVVIIGIAVSCIAILTPKKEVEVEQLANAHNIILDDVYLKAFIEAGLDSIVVDGGISEEEMLLAESLNLSGLGLESVEPLLYAENLKELDLSNNNITDITQLSILSKLEKINLKDNPIKDYAILDYLPQLKEVVK